MGSCQEVREIGSLRDLECLKRLTIPCALLPLRQDADISRLEEDNDGSREEEDDDGSRVEEILPASLEYFRICLCESSSYKESLDVYLDVSILKTTLQNSSRLAALREVVEIEFSHEEVVLDGKVKLLGEASQAGGT